MKKTIFLVFLIMSFLLGDMSAMPLDKSNLITVLGNIKKSAAISRMEASMESFEKFKSTVYKEPFENGVYIVNGDTPVTSDEKLVLFYKKEVVNEWPSSEFGIKLTVDAPDGVIASWNNARKKDLRYCISKDFGLNYEKVVNAMIVATEVWTEVSDVKFTHLIHLDSDCTATNNGVIFDVRPVDVSGQYLARAFFPRYERKFRNVLIDKSSLQLNPAGNLQLVGILRHELGHVLGFRHEHTRVEAGKCYEDEHWVPLSDYDAFSVMHYPQCNGLGDWSLKLTEKDKIGAACLYGPKHGTVFDETKCDLP